ncbi:MAG: DJ-1 family glyoxalase III [Eubacterium sp.]
MVYVFLADGFEIIEALSPVDMLRRAKADVKTVGVTGKTVRSSCGVEVNADIAITEIKYDELEAIVLPGGLQGTLNLEADQTVQKTIDYCVDNNILVCAICAAPSVLGHKGILRGKKATCFPGFEEALNGAVLCDDYVAVDGNFITARGAGVSVDFGLEIVSKLYGRELSDKIRKTIQCK